MSANEILPDSQFAAQRIIESAERPSRHKTHARKSRAVQGGGMSYENVKPLCDDPIVVLCDHPSRRKLWAVLFIIVVSLASVAYELRHMPFALRAWLPYPVNYVERLNTLQGWPAEIGDGLNCSGFISNAHSSPFRKSYEVYANSLGDMDLLGEVTNLHGIDESILRPGDIAAFHGPASSHPLQHAGVHVIAYLGGGIWTGTDSRRGNVAKYRLSLK